MLDSRETLRDIIALAADGYGYEDIAVKLDARDIEHLIRMIVLSIPAERLAGGAPPDHSLPVQAGGAPIIQESAG